jgi:hypothetical protein
MHSWNTFGAWTSHEHTQIHKTHHGPDLGEATTFPLIIFYVIHRGGYTQMAFFPWLQVGSPEIPKIGTPTILDTHNFLCKPSIEANSKAKL